MSNMCINCGCENDDDARYCSVCRAPLDFVEKMFASGELPARAEELDEALDEEAYDDSAADDAQDNADLGTN